MGKYRPIIKTAECKSLTQASQVLGYTQPSLGYTISNLENELGVKIFHRDQRGMTLTEAGERLMPFLKDAEQMDERILDLAKDCKSDIIRVGIFSSVATQWLPSTLREFCALYPDTFVKMEGIQTYLDGEHGIRQHSIDCCFYVGSCPKGMELIPLYEDFYYLVVSAESPLAHLSSISYDDLKGVHFLPNTESMDGNSSVNKLQQDLVENNKLDFVDIKDNQIILAMVEQGIGVTILPYLALKSLIPGRNVKVLPLEQPISRVIGLLTARKDKRSFLTNIFIGVVQRQVKKWMESFELP